MNGFLENDIQLKGGGPRLTLREEQKRITYGRLLNAAKELFESEHAGNVTIEQIAKRAGTNRTTFYLHFEDKADIAFRLRSFYKESDLYKIKHFLMKKGGVSRNDISKWIKDREKFVRGHKAMIKLGTDAINRKPELMQEFLDQTNEILDTGFNSFLDQFEKGERQLVFAEIHLCAMMLNRYLYITVIQGVEFPIKNTHKVMVEMWFNLLSRKPGGTLFP